MRSSCRTRPRQTLLAYFCQRIVGQIGLEAVITMLALQRRTLPLHVNCGTPDAALGLNLVLQPGTRAPQLQATSSSSFAFGGTNAALLFKRA